jgi:hypothetical protein
MAYYPKNARYYRLWAADCERAADNDATTPAERAIMLHCAARWHILADYHGAPPLSEKGESRDKGRRTSRRSTEIA